jgi:predicted nucleic acid-binding protein
VRDAIAAGTGAMCSVNLGEVLYAEARRLGRERALAGIEVLRRRLQIVEADWPLVRAAALVKARHRLSYADAFCVATAQRLRAPLWTGDPEILALADEVEVVDLR